MSAELMSPNNAANEKRPRLLSLRGRLDRQRYTAFTLGGAIACTMLMMLAAMLMSLTGSLGHTLYTIFAVLLMYVALPLYFFILTVKRAHDINAGGWLALLLLVPIVNLVFWVWPSVSAENQYGTPLEAPPFGVKLAAIALPILLIGGFLLTSPAPDVAPPQPAAPSTTLQPYSP